MNGNGEQSIMERLLGLNWRTTLGAAFTAGGLALAASVQSGKWHTIGLVAAAIGGAWTGINARDKAVTGAQMQAMADAKQDAKADAAFAKADAALPSTAPDKYVPPAAGPLPPASGG